MNVLIAKPMPPRISAPPTTLAHRRLRRCRENELAICTPTSDSGAEPSEHPEREPRVHGAELPVAHGAERLEDRAVEDVGADRDLRVEAEEQDQDRRHQAAAAHPGHADEDPDEQAGERELPGHVRGAAGSGRRRTAGRAAGSASLYASQPVQKPVTAASSASAATSSAEHGADASRSPAA